MYNYFYQMNQQPHSPVWQPPYQISIKEKELTNLPKDDSQKDQANISKDYSVTDDNEQKLMKFRLDFQRDQEQAMVEIEKKRKAMETPKFTKKPIKFEDDNEESVKSLKRVNDTARSSIIEKFIDTFKGNF